MSDRKKDNDGIISLDAIYEGIQKGIEVTFENKCYGPTVILILAGIDAMAYLSMPADQIEVTKQDYISWVERYIRLPGKEKITGYDLYGARCGMLHQYGVRSGLSRSGKCRVIGYVEHSVPEVFYNPEVATDLVIVSIKALKDAFFAAIDKFIPELFDDESKRSTVEERFNTLVNLHMLRLD